MSVARIKVSMDSRSSNMQTVLPVSAISLCLLGGWEGRVNALLVLKTH